MSQSALRPTVKASLHSPSLEGVGPRNDVCAVSTHQEAHALVEGVQVAWTRRHLCFLDDVQRIRRTHTQRCDVTRRLHAAVRVHAV